MSVTAEIRNFLMERFNDDELKTLCFDHFHTVYITITNGMTKAQIIFLLIEYCDTHNRLNALVQRIHAERPNQFTITVQDTSIEAPIKRNSPPRSERSAEYKARLDAVIQNSPIRPDKDHAYLYLEDPRHTADRDPGHSLDLFVRLDGGGYLFCGRAAERLESNILLFEQLIAGITTRCLRFFGEIYKRANYTEEVITGVAVTGLKGAISCFLRQKIVFDPHPFTQHEYRRLERSSATTLADEPDIVARKLVMPLIDTITQERHDPFKN